MEDDEEIDILAKNRRRQVRTIFYVIYTGLIQCQTVLPGMYALYT